MSQGSDSSDSAEDYMFPMTDRSSSQANMDELSLEMIERLKVSTEVSRTITDLNNVGTLAYLKKFEENPELMNTKKIKKSRTPYTLLDDLNNRINSQDRAI